MSLSMETAKAKLTCWAIRGHPHEGLRCFMSIMALVSSLDGPWGPGFRLFWREEDAILSIYQGLMEIQ